MRPYKEIDWPRVRYEQPLIKGVDQNIYTFDIEVSSGYILPGERVVEPFDYEKDPEYYKERIKVALCYEWQFGINDKYYYGRDLYEFYTILQNLNKMPGEKFIWIHNASYEQVFLQNLFMPDKIFAKKAHSVVYFTYKTITFRCSFQLTNLSLRSWAKELGAPPKLDNYDYDKIRTPNTPLDDFEKAYGERDLVIVYEGIKKFCAEYGLLQKIPLTQTARIRQDIQAIFKDDMRYKFHMARLIPKNEQEYARLRMAFSGGNVHANWYYSGILCKNVNSVDIASSYPYCCCTELLPMGRFKKALSRAQAEKIQKNKKFCVIAEVLLENITSRMYVDYLSYSKIYDVATCIDPITGREVEDIIAENGKIQRATSCKCMVTGIDLDIIREVYDGKITILNLWYSRGGYLDKRYIDYILDLYEKKTSLKGVEGMEDIYLNAKQKINGIYGDFVSSLCYDDTILTETGEWKEVEKTPIEVDQRLQYLKENPWRLKSSYAWGVFITAAARRNHFDILKELDKTNSIIYYDTDSVYYFGNHDKAIKAYNKEKIERIDAVLSSMGIDPERSRPKNKKGQPKQMGILEKEHTDLPEFKAIRAKCYGYRDEQGQLHITISGVNKNTGVNALHGTLDRLDNKLVFNYKECQKKISNYNRDQPECIWIDENGVKYTSTYKYGLNLQPTQYRLTLGQEFYDVLNMLGALSCKMSQLTVDELKKIEGGMPQ